MTNQWPRPACPTCLRLPLPSPPLSSPNVMVTALLRVTVVRHSTDHKSKDHPWTNRKIHLRRNAAFFAPSYSCPPLPRIIALVFCYSLLSFTYYAFSFFLSASFSLWAGSASPLVILAMVGGAMPPGSAYSVTFAWMLKGLTCGTQHSTVNHIDMTKHHVVPTRDVDNKTIENESSTDWRLELYTMDALLAMYAHQKKQPKVM